MPPIPGIPRTILVAPEGFSDRLKAAAVADAVAAGLEAEGWPTDRCPLISIAELDELRFDIRLRAARALVCGTERLHRDALAGTLFSEVATRARQIGVPCHAVAAVNELDAFDARLLDLQTIAEARTRSALRRAAAKLAVVL